MGKRKLAKVIADNNGRSRSYRRASSKTGGGTNIGPDGIKTNAASDFHGEHATLAKSKQAQSPEERPPITNTQSIRLVDEILQKVGLDSKQTIETKSGWCLRQGLNHIVTADNGKLAPLVKHHGPPTYYSFQKENQTGCRHQQEWRHDATQQLKDPQTCFQSLCRIIAGQQLAGSAAQAVWKRLLETTKHNLTPQTIMDLVGVSHCYDDGEADKTKIKKKSNSSSSLVVEDVSKLQKPAGLSRAKAHSIVHLAHAFQSGHLTEEFLTSTKSLGANDNGASDNDKLVREALLQIKGVGPWSCDMFFMFYLEKPNILPLGDLGVRKGIAKYFAMAGKGGTLCPKKDASRIHQRLNSYHPYQSLLTYYMWRAADTPEFYRGNNQQDNTSATDQPIISSPKKNSNGKAKKISVVTP